MSDDGFALGASVVAVLALVIGVPGCCEAYSAGERTAQTEAVERGFGELSVDPKTRKVGFHWKTPLEKK